MPTQHPNEAAICERIAQKGGIVIVPPFKAARVWYVKIRCGSGHVWIPRVHNLMYSDSWCPDCYGNRPDCIEFLREWAQRLGGQCLSDEYTGNKDKYRWECGQCENQWDAAWYNVKNHQSWCPRCKNSIREELVRAAFQEFFTGEEFGTDRDTIGMELDGYSEAQCLAFECDGQQHRERVPHFQRKEGDFEAQVARDKQKDERCDGAGITLVRVPDVHLLSHGGVRGYVHLELQTLGYTPPAELVSDAEFMEGVQAARVRDKYIEDARRFAARDRIELFAEACPTRTWPLRALCPEGHEFTTHCDNLSRGRGCPDCSHNRPKEENEIEEAVAARGYQFFHTETRADEKRKSRRYITVQCPEETHDPFEMLWDNFVKGRGCTICGSARTGSTKKCPAAQLERRLEALGFTCDLANPALNQAAIFTCPQGHRITTTVKKLEMAEEGARCPACTAAAFEDVELLTPYTPETDPIKDKLRWQCRACGNVSETTYRGMRIRKKHCSNRHCPGL